MLGAAKQGITSSSSSSLVSGARYWANLGGGIWVGPVSNNT